MDSWIVVILYDYEPVVSVFEKYEEAKKTYDEYIEYASENVYIAKIKQQKIMR